MSVACHGALKKEEKGATHVCSLPWCIKKKEEKGVTQDCSLPWCIKKKEEKGATHFCSLPWCIKNKNRLNCGSSQLKKCCWQVPLRERCRARYLLCDGAVDVRDHHLVIKAPLVDVAFAPGGPLVSSGHAEHHLVSTLVQV